MEKSIKTRSTSRKTAVCSDIILRLKTTTRLIFRPQLIDNPHNKKHCLKGKFIYQRKKRSGKWCDYGELTLSHLKDAEWFKLELHSKELYDLITQLDSYYQIFERYGIRRGNTEFIITPKTIGSAIKQLLDDKEHLGRLIEQGGAELLLEMLKWMSNIDNPQIAVDTLKTLDIGSLQRLNSILGVNAMRQVLCLWQSDKGNNVESFWQRTFTEYSWVIAQVFAWPVIIFGDQAYVGGKKIDNKGGKIVDFLYVNKLTDNVLLVEIKTPMTKLMGARYRNGIFSISAELSGAVTQILDYKEQLQRNYASLVPENGSSFYAFNPRCLLVVGSYQEEKFDRLKKKSFELFRSDSRNIDILTFDELFSKVKLQLDMLEQTLPLHMDNNG